MFLHEKRNNCYLRIGYIADLKGLKYLKCLIVTRARSSRYSILPSFAIYHILLPSYVSIAGMFLVPWSMQNLTPWKAFTGRLLGRRHRNYLYLPVGHGPGPHGCSPRPCPTRPPPYPLRRRPLPGTPGPVSWTGTHATGRGPVCRHQFLYIRVPQEDVPGSVWE